MQTKQMIKEFFNVFFRKQEIGDDEDIFELGFVNSLFAMQLVMFLEKEFAIKVDNQDLDLDHFRTVNKIVHFIETKKGQ